MFRKKLKIEHFSYLQFYIKVVYLDSVSIVECQDSGQNRNIILTLYYSVENTQGF